MSPTPSIADYLVPFAQIVALAWAATEGIGRMMTWPKPLIAVVSGMALALVFHGAGFLPDFNRGLWDWLLAAVVGAFASVGAGAFHDYVVKAVFPGRAQS
jgi:hypothetical protein